MTERAGKRHWPWYLLFGAIYFLAVTLLVTCGWYHRTYNVGFKELLYTMLGPLEGAGNSVVDLVLASCVPPILWLTAGYVVAGFLVSECRWNMALWTWGGRWKFPVRLMAGLRRAGAAGCVLLLLASGVFVERKFNVSGYIAALNDQTMIYDTDYIDPAQVAITPPEKPKNLIYLYLESMETTYMAQAEGGVQSEALMPNLSRLARENVSFRGTNTPSGFRPVTGTIWTIASLVASTAGIPFSFPVEDNAMDVYDHFAPGLTNLGDILAGNGYRQEFLCGSDAKFGGRANYFTQHGAYSLFDLFTARETGYIPPDYYVWWGFEDAYLFEIAKDEITRLAAGDGPFNMTLLTVDLHHLGGYVCPWCEEKHENRTADVVNCTDRQVGEFIAWCREQPFCEDTVIVISGDHPRQDLSLVEGVDYLDRTVYQTILNPAIQPAEGAMENREFTAMDMFPTTLAALGFRIEGERLGLGTNLFSGMPTLAERLGVEALDAELNKYSQYFMDHFN